MPHISIVWDFDGTLSPEDGGDSTTKVVEILEKGTGSDFWNYVKNLRGDTRKPKWEHVLASDAPIWMYALSKLAYKHKIPLNKEFFREIVAPAVLLYPNVIPFLGALNSLSTNDLYKDVSLTVNSFIVSAGLKELITQKFPDDLIKYTYGCLYKTIVETEGAVPESIPVYCIDETMKTRCLFEISKGSFCTEGNSVNVKISPDNLWSPFENIIYIGDGFSDVPSFSLVRSKGGAGIAVYDPSLEHNKIRDKHKQLRTDKRVDLICPADFNLDSKLFLYIKYRCDAICDRYHAAQPLA